MKIAVLGAGILGVSSAWWLAQSGHEVLVIERQPGPALETSRANGGQISVCHAEPWASTHTLGELWRHLGRRDAAMRLVLQPDWHQWLWGARFLMQCRPARYQANLRAMVTLALYSRQQLKALRQQLGLQYNQRACGILTFYHHEPALVQARRHTAAMRALGVDRQMLDVAQLLQIEPALSSAQWPIVGGDYTPEDESGDAHQFTQALADHAQRAGVTFLYGHQVHRLIAVDGRLAVAEVTGPDGWYRAVQADAWVVALGSHSAALLRPLGVPCPVWPAKGYSATFALRDVAAAPRVSLIQKATRLVFSRLGDQLRVAGTAEIGGYSRALDTRRCNSLVEQVRRLFPSALDFDNVRFWSGLRPTTPSHVPLIGPTRLRNVFLNTGHGSLGWTMGVGSGKALADIVSGRVPEIDFPFLS